MAYTGEHPQPTSVDEFERTLIAHPGIMATALSMAAEAPVDTDRIEAFLGRDTEELPIRAEALHAVNALLNDGSVSGRFRFDRVTERSIATDKTLRALELRRRAASNVQNAAREAEVVRQIRARRLSIYAGSLAAAHRAHTPRAA